MKPLILAAALAAAASPALANGGCVGQVLLPPTEGVRNDRVLVEPGRTERLHLPAQVVRSRHAVLLRPARSERLSRPALYRTERRLVSVPGPVHWEHGPERYREEAETVVVQPGHYVWQRRAAPVVSAPPEPGQTVVSPTGLVMCRVWCPARTETVVHRVRLGPGPAYAVHTRATRVITRRLLVRPAGVEVRRIPAEYRWAESERVVAPGRWLVRREPARYAWRQVREVHAGGSAYTPVVCGGPLSAPAMARMQGSLAAAGYDPGPSDGVGRPQTYDALRRYQQDHRMAAGQVTVESARALGVIP